MTRIITLMFLLCCALTTTVRAQEEMTNEEKQALYRQRISGDEDTKDRYMRMYNYFATEYGNKNYAAAYPCWKELMTVCPKFSVNFYAQGEYMLSQMLLQGVPMDSTDMRVNNFRSLPTEAQGMYHEIYKDMMWMFDNRIELCDTLNSYPENGKKEVFTRGDIMMNKAFYDVLLGKLYSPQYDELNTHQMLSDAFREVELNGGHDVRDFVIRSFYNISKDLYVAEPDKYIETFLSDYFTLIEVCDNIRNVRALELQAEGKMDEARRVADEYGRTYDDLEANFVTSNLTDDTLRVTRVFGASIAQNAEDQEALDLMLRSMRKCHIDTLQVYYDCVDASYSLGRTSENCLGKAKMAITRNQPDAAISYYSDAIRTAPDGEQKSFVARQAADALAAAGLLNKAEEYYDQAISYNYDALGSISYGKARLYYIQSTNIKPGNPVTPPTKTAEEKARAAKYFEARAQLFRQKAELLEKAMRACDEAASDPNYRARANNLKNQLAQPLAAATKNAATQVENIANLTKKSAQELEYEAYLKKKKEEDDFWNGRR